MKRFRISNDYQLDTRRFYWQMMKHFSRHTHWFVGYGTDRSYIEFEPELSEQQMTFFELLNPGMIAQEDPAVE